MTRYFILVVFMFSSLVSAFGQGDHVRALNSGGGMAGNVSYSYGNLFYNQPSNSNLSASEGVMQAQMIRVDMELAGCQISPEMNPAHVKDTSKFFQGYDGEEMVFDGNTFYVFPSGHYDSTAYDALHYNWDSRFNYDSLTTLTMDIWPVYEHFNTLYIDSAILAGYAYDSLHFDPALYDPLHGGHNKYYLATLEHGCDSIQHYFVNLCGGLIADGNGYQYGSLFMGTAPNRFCWTAANMRNTIDAFGNPIQSMIYVSPTQPNAEENLNIYGRLYTWYAAVGLPEDSEDEPARTNNGGFVTGICPRGWHIPESINITSLYETNAFDLISCNYWLTPGTNSSGFNALPAGIYNAERNRFENMLGETHYWSSEICSTKVIQTCSLMFGCDISLVREMLANNGVSVRCVKNQMFDDYGNELND